MTQLELDQEVTDLLLTALELENYPPAAMVYCRHAIECIVHNKYFQETGEKIVEEKGKKFPSIIDITEKLNRMIGKQSRLIIGSINAQSRGSLHWDFETRGNAADFEDVKLVIEQIKLVYFKIFNNKIKLEGLKISEHNLGMNLKQAVNKSLTEQGITRYSTPSINDVNKEELNTILNIAEAANDKEVKFDNWEFVRLGNAAKLNGKLELSEGYYRQSFRNFKIENNREGEAASQNNLGNIFRIRGDLEEAERLYKQSISVAREIRLREREAGSLNNLGLIFRIRGDLEEAEKLFKESLAISIDIDFRLGELNALSNLGTIAKYRDDLDEAEMFYKECLTISIEIEERIAQSDALLSLGNIARNKENFEDAGRLYKESLKIHRETGNRKGEASSINNLGNVSGDIGNLDEAERLYKESLKIDREIGDRLGEATSLNNLGENAVERGNLLEAVRLYEESLAIVKEIGYRLGEETTLGNIAELLEVLEGRGKKI